MILAVMTRASLGYTGRALTVGPRVMLLIGLARAMPYLIEPSFCSDLSSLREWPAQIGIAG